LAETYDEIKIDAIEEIKTKKVIWERIPAQMIILFDIKKNLGYVIKMWL
jgi:hypothetical protein